MRFKKLSALILSAIMLFAFVTACDNTTQDVKDISAKSFTPQSSYTVGETFTIADVSIYFENTTADTTYLADKGTITEKAFSLSLTTAGQISVKITGTENGKTANLEFTLNVVDATVTEDISAKTFTPQSSYTVGETFTIADVSVYFEHTTANTTYSADKGTVAGKAFSLSLTTAGQISVKITGTENGKTADLEFTLNVINATVIEDISAKTFTPQESYAAGETFTIADVSVYFEHTTASTTYTADKGTITGKAFSLILSTTGQISVKITGTENGKTADLSFTLNVVNRELTAAELAALNKARAIEYAKTIYSKYWVAGSPQSSKLTPGGGTPYLWPYTEQAGMLNSLMESLDPVEDATDYTFFSNYLKEVLEGFRYYRIQAGSKPYTNTAFGVLGENKDTYACYSSGRSSSTKDNRPQSKGGTYFDDNIWVAKEFYFAWKNLGEEKYLNECINILNWIIGEGYETRISAEGEHIGRAMNGIYWLWSVKDIHNNNSTDDSKTASLNACSSAPTSMMLLKVANDAALGAEWKTLKDDYADKGQKIFNFVRNVLNTPSTHAMPGLTKDKVFIRINAAEELYLGLIDEQILGYNTGCMMTAGVELYKRVGAAGVLSITTQIADSSDKYFPNTIQVAGQYSYDKNSWFTSFLLEGYIDLYPHYQKAEEYAGHMASALNYAWENNKASDGLVSPSWILGWSAFTDDNVNSENNPRQILLQSANAHCYAMLAKFYAAVNKK